MKDKKSFGFYYIVNKKQYTIKSRDFVEKGFAFSHNGKFYKYSSTVENSEHIKGKYTEETIRGDTLINF